MVRAEDRMSDELTNDFVPILTPYGEFFFLFIAAIVVFIAAIIVILYQADKWSNYRHWRRIVEEREAWVADGCPRWERGKYGGWIMAADPFGIDHMGIGRLQEFPDLHKRDIAAGTKARIIGNEQRAIRTDGRYPLPQEVPDGWESVIG